jgi:hypothetical protein
MREKSGTAIWCLAFSAMTLFLGATATAENDGASRYPVLVDGKYGFIDRHGKIRIEPRFDEADRFQEGLAAVALDGKWGYIDDTGKMVIEPQFASLWNRQFSDGLAPANAGRDYSEQNWGFIDRKGAFVIKPKFEFAAPFCEGLANVQVKGKFGFVNSSGEFVIEPWLVRAGFFSEGLAAARNEHREMGFLDKQGKVAIPFDFFFVRSFSEGIAPATTRDSANLQ